MHMNPSTVALYTQTQKKKSKQDFLIPIVICQKPSSERISICTIFTRNVYHFSKTSQTTLVKEAMNNKKDVRKPT
jgi:hypothetical protein